ncbi:MAG: hypothetical protein HYS81_01710 [Candidatus Aenigmatarchaeota archaeon]|nr:MAG: hypothetical protein HYS81_01710 [Candidatus Aenigmarchaeota archaeon]
MPPISDVATDRSIPYLQEDREWFGRMERNVEDGAGLLNTVFFNGRCVAYSAGALVAAGLGIKSSLEVTDASGLDAAAKGGAGLVGFLVSANLAGRAKKARREALQFALEDRIRRRYPEDADGIIKYYKTERNAKRPAKMAREICGDLDKACNLVWDKALASYTDILREDEGAADGSV